MALLTRLVILIPLAFSIVAFVLSSLCLFAGHNDGFMEDYAIARVNVSMLGQDLIMNLRDDDDEEAEAEDDEDDGGFFDSVREKWDDAKDRVVEKINEVANDVVGDVADTIGIADWYSVHVMNACEGDYTPNGTVPGAGFNGTNCTDSSPAYRFNLTDMLDKDLSVGPFDLNLADLGWKDEIQEKLDILNDALLGLFILYVLGMAFSGLAFLSCIAAFFLIERKSVMLLNFGFATLAALALTIGSILITVAATKGVNEINDLGEDVGINVQRGTNFLILTWVAAGAMMFALLFWAGRFFMQRRKQKRVGGSRRHHKERYSNDTR